MIVVVAEVVKGRRKDSEEEGNLVKLHGVKANLPFLHFPSILPLTLSLSFTLSLSLFPFGPSIILSAHHFGPDHLFSLNALSLLSSPLTSPPENAFRTFQSLPRRRRHSRPSLGGPYRVAKKVRFDDITVVESPTVCTSFASGCDATQTPISLSYRSYERLNIYIRRLEPGS